ncbi:MAG: PIN domain-containing protein [Verrucomicrobiota bacterium]
MKYLLDVNVLLQGIWKDHPDHEATFKWLQGKAVVVCPLAELGFIRVSTGALGAPMAETRQLLERFLSERNAGRIADDLPALGSMPKTSGQVTDHYLADLAQMHGIQLATFDQKISHPAVQSIG